jgi:nucleoside-diphosphate-sugar epimerase
MAKPILVTGAAGRVGGVGRTVTELLLKQGKAVRAMVRNEDERARALRDMGAEVVVGNLRCAAADWRAARRPRATSSAATGEVLPSPNGSLI